MGKKRAVEREAKTREMEQQIRQYTAEMAWEINWRLVCDQTGTSATEAHELWKLLHLAGQEALWTELCMPGQILWVEEVIPTAISYPKEHLGFAARLKMALKKAFTYIGRLLRNKGRRGKKHPNFVR